MMKNLRATIANLIDAALVSIISSVDKDGFPNSKAMLPPRKRVGIRELYFTTNTASNRVKQYTDNQKACVYFFDNRTFQGVMLRGNMTVLHDQETKAEIWRDGDERYYAEGISDPDYCILKFTAENGRYYSHFRSTDFAVDTDDQE